MDSASVFLAKSFFLPNSHRFHGLDLREGLTWLSISSFSVGLLRDLIFHLALTLRRFAHGAVRLQTLTVFISLVHPNTLMLRCNQFHFDDDQTFSLVLLHIFGLLPGPPEFLQTLLVVSPLDPHADVRHHCADWFHTVR